MDLSTAIRLGAAKRPQTFYNLFDVAYNVAYAGGVTLGSCAMGAAYEAMTGSADVSATTGAAFGTLAETFPILSQVAQCPACQRESRVSFIITVHLNDRHLWTREAIADWLETL